MTPYRFDHTFSDLAKFDKYFVGADKFLAKIQETADLVANTAATAGYPPFNLKKTADNVYVIEMAVAGFGQSDIEVTLEGNKLIVNGKAKNDTEDAEYLHTGIANRAFTRTFTVDDKLEIKDAELVNGMLRICFDNMMKAQDMVKKITVKEAK